MHYNTIKTAAGARTRLRLPMLWHADAVAAEELPEAVFWVFISGERVRVEKKPGSDDEYIFPALPAGQYAWDLVVEAQVVLHGVLKVRGSAVPPGGGEVCGTLLVDAPAMVLVLSPGPRGEVGPVGPQGLSAYEVALQHGYEGSEDDWAEELSGAQAAATAAKEQATEAGKQAKAAADSATTASEQATEAGKQAEAAAGSATTASEQATEAGKQAKAAAGSATTASEQATAAANSATAAATAADAVKYDLLPMSVDWLHTQFEKEIGEANFTVTLNDEAKTLNVAVAHNVTAAQCEELLALAGRVCPKSVMVVLDEVPLDFTELVYLESSGTQYIDTGVITDGSYTISVTFKSIPNSTNLEWICGRQNTWTANEFVGDSLIYFYNPDRCVYVYQGARCKTATLQGDTFDVVWSEGTMTIIVNGEEQKLSRITSNSIDASNPTNKSHYLFKPNGDITSTAGRICGFSAWDGEGAKVINLIPVLDETDEPCMWDTVSRQKLPNDGQGRFGYRIKATDEVVKPNATTYSLRAPRDPYYVAPSGVYARLVLGNELEILADTEETTGDGWEWFANVAEAHEHFGIVPLEEEF